MLKRLRGAAIAVSALVITSSVVWAAGNWSTLPVIGSASYCASTVTGTGSLGGITGQGQGSTGSICAQTVPAGPTIVTGNEVIPADLNNPANITATQGGVSPTTALVSMASLNALPLSFQSAPPTNATNTFTAGTLTGGIIFNGTAAISPTTVTLPATPIDGQQFRISSNQTIATLTVTATAASAQTINNNPTALTVSTTAAYGYDFVYHAATTSWFRLQ